MENGNCGGVMLSAADIESSMQIAGLHLQNGQLEQVEEICANIIRNNERYADAHHLRAIACHHMGRTEEAIGYIRQAISINKLAPQYHAALGSMLAVAGDFENAQKALKLALSIQPNDVETLFNLGLICLNLEVEKEAVDAFNRAVQLAPMEPALHAKLGVALHQTGAFDKAIEAYSESIRLDPSNAEVIFNLGLSQVRQSDLNEALKSFEKTVQIAPDYQLAYSQICNLKRTSGEYEEAVIAGRKAISLNPEDLKTLMDLSYALSGTGETAEAVEISRRAVDLAPQSVAHQIRLGYAHLCNHEPELALTACEQGLSISPNNIPGLAFKASALNELGRRDEAGFIHDFDRIIQVKNFQAVEGYDTVPIFNAALADHIHAHPSLKYSENNRSLKHGQGTE
jgi:protein O-GlcNAc transferase